MVFIDSCNGFREIAIPILLPRVHVGITGITDRMVGTAQATRFYDPFTIAASSLRDIFNRYSFFSLPKEKLTKSQSNVRFDESHSSARGTISSIKNFPLDRSIEGTRNRRVCWEIGGDSGKRNRRRNS